MRRGFTLGLVLVAVVVLAAGLPRGPVPDPAQNEGSASGAATRGEDGDVRAAEAPLRLTPGPPDALFGAPCGLLAETLNGRLIDEETQWDPDPVLIPLHARYVNASEVTAPGGGPDGISGPPPSRADAEMSGWHQGPGPAALVVEEERLVLRDSHEVFVFERQPDGGVALVGHFAPEDAADGVTVFLPEGPMNGVARPLVTVARTWDRPEQAALWSDGERDYVSFVNRAGPKTHVTLWDVADPAAVRRVQGYTIAGEAVAAWSDASALRLVVVGAPPVTADYVRKEGVARAANLSLADHLPEMTRRVGEGAATPLIPEDICSSVFVASNTTGRNPTTLFDWPLGDSVQDPSVAWFVGGTPLVHEAAGGVVVASPLAPSPGPEHRAGYDPASDLFWFEFEGGRVVPSGGVRFPGVVMEATHWSVHDGHVHAVARLQPRPQETDGRAPPTRWHLVDAVRTGHGVSLITSVPGPVMPRSGPWGVVGPADALLAAGDEGRDLVWYLWPDGEEPQPIGEATAPVRPLAALLTGTGQVSLVGHPPDGRGGWAEWRTVVVSLRPASGTLEVLSEVDLDPVVDFGRYGRDTARPMARSTDGRVTSVPATFVVATESGGRSAVGGVHLLRHEDDGDRLVGHLTQATLVTTQAGYGVLESAAFLLGPGGAEELLLWSPLGLTVHDVSTLSVVALWRAPPP